MAKEQSGSQSSHNQNKQKTSNSNNNNIQSSSKSQTSNKSNNNNSVSNAKSKESEGHSNASTTENRTAEIALIRQEVATLLAAAGYVVPEDVDVTGTSGWTEVVSTRKNKDVNGKLATISEEETTESLEKGKPLKLTVEDVQAEIDYWNLAVYGYVMGANPPWEVLEGYLRRIWQNYEITKISFLPNGLFVVRFAKLEHHKLVLAQDMFLFDGKPIILRAWDPNVRISKVSVKTVPIWAKLVGLDLKFWGKQCLEKLAGLLGKFLKIDELTLDKKLLGYAKVMVEVEVDKSYPNKIVFEDENGQEVTVLVEYDWLPITCLKCKGVGHRDIQCRGRVPRRSAPVQNQTGPKQVWRKKPEPVRVLDPKEFPDLPGTGGGTEQSVAGTSKPSPAANSGLITPACVQQRSSYTPARILTRITRHESRVPGGQRDVKWYMHHSNVSLFGLLETRVKPRSLNKVAKNICEGWSFTTNYNYHSGGRIWVLWKDSHLKIDIIVKSAQYIHVKATTIEGCHFFVTFVYGYNKIEERVPLWNDLMAWSITQPWVVLGDFNNVMYSNERIGKIVKDAEMKPFQDVVAACELQDIKTTGAFFTWTNKQPSETRVYSRIDRVLVNNEWVRKWPDYYAYYAPEGYFDHLSLPCGLCVRGIPRRKPFKFFNMWSKVSDFQEVVKKLQADTGNKILMDVEYQLRESYLVLAQAREDYLRQKSKAHWAKDGDDNTAMFHRIIQQRNIQNKVMRIEDKEGKCCTDPEDILQAFVAYYKALLGENGSTSSVYTQIVEKGEKVHSEDWAKLCAIPTNAEIKTVVFSIPDDKSPGPDGYSSCFFKASWAIIEEDMCKAVKDFFFSGKLLKQFNCTNLVLIPKVDNPVTVKEFRPIACCNVVYKVISKLLCNRLSQVLPYLISPSQSAFIKGRSIMGNILISQDLVRLYNRRNVSPRCMLKVDLRKAYDTIEWTFVRQMMVSLKFPLKFVEWIMQCVTTTSFSVVLNGQTYGFFAGQRGLRQGDPLSPLLFTVCMEYLSRLMAEARGFPGFKFHPLCRGIKLTHLMFADDLLLFCKGDIKSVTIMLEVFHCFSNASGLTISSEKSDIILNGIDDDTIGAILEHTGFKKGSLPFKYLGVKISHKRLTKTDCNVLVDRMLFVLPAGVMERIQALCRNFLWEGGENYTKAPLVAWSVLCKGKDEGGLGLVDLKTWNIAAIGKLVWWIAKKKDHLWIQWVDKIYMKGRSWLNYQPTAASSWAWRKIWEVKKKFQEAYNQGKWMTDGDKYTIAKGYDWLVQSTPKIQWHKSAWNRFNIQRHCFIQWLIKHERLLTLDRLHKMGVNQSTTCYICGMAAESHKHLFQDCVYVTKCYKELYTWLGVSDQRKQLVSADKVLQQRGWSGFVRLATCALVVALQYHIWQTRNLCRLEGIVPQPRTLLKWIQNEFKMRLMAVSKGTMKHHDLMWCQNRGL
ncbi:uncharacterized protein LOC141639953, partial [Silene latifolia]|uniref:uncharacterized protein LOC141639953 n=1 Tax=Silene latifolia TaxID=37657 RepID=UPI003D780332